MAQEYVHDMRGCMLTCNTTSDCSSFSYLYQGDEPTDSDTTTLRGNCYLKKGSYQLMGNGQGNVAMAVSVGSAAPAAPATSSVSTVMARSFTQHADSSDSVPEHFFSFDLAGRCQHCHRHRWSSG